MESLINTIIAVFSAPFRQKGDGLIYSAKFAVFKKPFEDVITAENLIDIESIEDTLNTDSYRVISIPQKKLLEEGWEYPENITEEHKKAFKFSVGKYNGNKWGGKYLRAPDIFFTILEKGKGKLVRLGDIAEVRFGIKTGANEFFYLPSKHFDIKKEGAYYKLIPKHEGLPEDLTIEEEYLRPVIISPRDVNRYIFQAGELKSFVFFCPSDAPDKSAGVKAYIKFGEECKFHNIPTLKARNPWWQIKEHRNSKLLWAMMHAGRHNTHYNLDRCEVDHNFFEIIPKDERSNDLLAAQAVSTLLILMKELLGRAYGGGSGPIKNEGIDIKQYFFISPEKIHSDYHKALLDHFQNLGVRSLREIFEEVGIEPKQPIRTQKPDPLSDRKALDDVVFDILGLTQAERDEVYWAVCELVRNRLEKAKSV